MVIRLTSVAAACDIEELARKASSTGVISSGHSIRGRPLPSLGLAAPDCGLADRGLAEGNASLNHRICHHLP